MRELLAFIFRELKPYKKTVILCSVLAFVAAGLDIAAPMAMGRGFDLANGRAPILWYGGVLFVWFLLRDGSNRLRNYIQYRGNVIGEYISTGTQDNAIVALMRKPLSFHYGKRSGDTTETISKFINEIANIISSTIFNFVPTLISIFAVLIYLVATDWRIAFIVALAVGVYIVYTAKIGPVVIENQTAWNKSWRHWASFGWDALRNALIVKSTANEQAVQEALRGRREEVLKAMKKDVGYDRYVGNIQVLIADLGTGAAFFFGAYNLAHGTITFGRLTAITAYTFAIFGSISYVQWQIRIMRKVTATRQALQTLLDVPEENFATGVSADLKGDVEFRNVRFGYSDDKPILQDVSFTVKPGQSVAIVGESGVGKTTLVDLIGRYYLPQSGEILFDGRSGADINLRSLREQLALVPQDLSIFHESIGFNIGYGKPGATEEEIREAARLANIADFIEKLPEKYGAIVGERGLKLSGGERQRIALARAFLRNPKILILDEPTSQLDSKNESAIQSSLDQLMKGRTTFIIAHRLRTIMDADVILVLKEGRIAEIGRHQELAAKPNGVYASLLKYQSGFITPGEQHLGEEDEE